MFLRAVKWWIVISTLASVAGWTLSALGALNWTGYAVFAAGVVVWIVVRRRGEHRTSNTEHRTSNEVFRELRKLKRRFGRFLPASFAVLAGLVFISGALYAPNDHTALSYRLPRVLQWLMHGHWFWIHTPNYRMNDRACGIEWLSAPLLLFLRSDRALFLLNFIPFILMPGLIFSVWTRLGVRPRVAWSWMWLVPTGYCFLLQAGGIGNDAFPTVYVLAAIDFALRARVAGRGSRVEGGRSLSSIFNSPSSDLFLSLLSAAVLVGAKASNLPLGLPWAVVFVPAVWHSLRPATGKSPEPAGWKACATSTGASGKAPARSVFGVRCSMFDVSAWVFILAVGVLVSFVPTALLNIRYLHDWSGLSIEHTGMAMKDPVAGVLGNSLLLVTENFMPTFFPMASWWNHHALEYLPKGMVRLMDANFEYGYIELREMPTEDGAGLGFGLSVLVVISILAGLLRRVQSPGTSIRLRSEATARQDIEHRTSNIERSYLPFSTLYSRFVLLAPWAALLAYCMKTGMVTPARLISPYYPLLFPALLIGAGQGQVVRRRWWNVCAGATLLLALAALVVTPSRPLWPWQTVLDKMLAARPGQPQLVRAKNVYEVYAHRSDTLAQMRQWFPPGLKVIGFVGTGDDLDISLWKPYGSRRVERFFVEDSGEMIRSKGVEYVVVGDFILQDRHTNIDEWLHRTGAQLLETTTATMTVSQGEQKWYLVRMQ